MANLDVYQVTLFQRFLGQSMLNVFFYQAREYTGLVDMPQQLLSGFNSVFSTDAGGVAFEHVGFSVDLLHIGTQVRNLFDDSEIANSLQGGLPQGTNTTQNDSPFLSYRLVCSRTRGDMRNGNKYFGGVCVSQAFDGLVNATILAALAATEGACEEIIIYDNAGDYVQFVPVIVKRIFVEATEETPEHYRLPESLSELTSYDATAWTASDVMTTRNSRKLSRGI